MKTPKEYTKSIREKIITKQMLLDCLYSSNKRAKNYRDKEREYRSYYRGNRYAYDKYRNEEKMRNQKEKYYEQKEILLSIIDPTCIHKEPIGYKKIRIYDYQTEEYKKHLKAGDFVWENCYWDAQLDREVWFGDIEDYNEPIYHYYLFYDIGGDHTFHTPITESQIQGYKDLQVIDIDHLDTYGHDVTDLISNQFVSKVITLIQSGDFVYKMK